MLVRSYIVAAYVTSVLASSVPVQAAYQGKAPATPEMVEASVVAQGETVTKQVLNALDSLPYWLPHYPGAVATISSISQQSNGLVSSTVTLSSVDTVDAIAAFYSQSLARPYLSEVIQAGDAYIRNLYVATPDNSETCDITITAGEAGEPVSILINYNRNSQ